MPDQVGKGPSPSPKSLLWSAGSLHYHAHVQREKLSVGVINLPKIMLEIVAKLHIGAKSTKLQLVP